LAEPASACRLSTIAQTALLETPVTRSSEPKSASKSNERTESPLALGDSAVVLPDSGHDSIAKSRGKRKPNGTSVMESTQPKKPTESLVDEAGPVVSPEIRSEEQQGSTSKQQQPTRTTRRKNQKSPEAVRERRKTSKVVTEVVEAQNEHEEETSEDEMQVSVLHRTGQNRSRKPLATVEEEDSAGEEEPDSGGENEEGSKVAKVPQKAPKSHSRPSRPRAVPAKILKCSSANVRNSKKRQKKPLSASGEGVGEENQDVSGPRTSRESVPITVHRLSRLQALQFGDDDQSILYGPPPFPKRTSVNAVDVLGQACSEIIAKIVDKVDAAAESGRIEGTKGDSKTMKRAARTFGTELESRLFDMVSCEPLGTVSGNWFTDTNAVRSA